MGRVYTLTDADIEKFWSLVNKSPEPDGCWIWSRATAGHYGIFATRSGSYPAHRVAWVLVNGPIPDGLVVCHNCPTGDNKSCVRPSHAFLGTTRQNILDASRKGRMRNKQGFSAAYQDDDVVSAIRYLEDRIKDISSPVIRTILKEATRLGWTPDPARPPRPDA